MVQPEMHSTELQYLALSLLPEFGASDKFYSNYTIFKVPSNPDHSVLLFLEAKCVVKLNLPGSHFTSGRL